MTRLRSIWTAWPPVLKALAAQGAAFALVFLAAAVLPKATSLWFWALIQGGFAAVLARLAGLGPGWAVFQVLLPCALVWQIGQALPGWLFPALLALLLLVFGGGLLTRVPLYNSNRAAWRELAGLVPETGAFRFADLGAGLGGPLAFLAGARPEAHFLGVEASPLVWLVAWLRVLPRRNCRVRLGSLWTQSLCDFDLVFAFLSPAPMPALWDKASAEMRPGTLLVSHSFEVPSALVERRIPLPGRPGACLLLYRIPAKVKPPENSPKT